MKQLLVYILISIILVTNTKTYDEHIDENEIVNVATDERIIPDEAIRLRIIANSNSTIDQQIKYTIRDRVTDHITDVVQYIDDIEEARRLIEENVPAIEKIVTQSLQEYNRTYNSTTTYATDVPFPLKTYGNVTYPEGQYEAILITLGDGIGDNWWCVLFPPLCFLDFFNENETTIAEAHDEDEAHIDEQEEELDSEEDDEIDIRFFFFDLFNFS